MYHITIPFRIKQPDSHTLAQHLLPVRRILYQKSASTRKMRGAGYVCPTHDGLTDDWRTQGLVCPKPRFADNKRGVLTLCVCMCVLKHSNIEFFGTFAAYSFAAIIHHQHVRCPFSLIRLVRVGWDPILPNLRLWAFPIFLLLIIWWIFIRIHISGNLDFLDGGAWSNFCFQYNMNDMVAGKRRSASIV